MILVIDNFDSFTYNFVDYLQQLGQQVEVKRNNLPFKEIIQGNYAGVVLSPGPGIPENAGQLMPLVDYFAGEIPILGICLGHQAIGAHFGCRLKKALKPMHGKLSVVTHTKDPIFNEIPVHFNVVRYHSLVCHRLPNDLIPLATSQEGELMAMKHAELPVYGLQFHPEAVLTEYGLEILRNWINLNFIQD